MTVLGARLKAVTANVIPGDIGYVKRGDGHCVWNIDNTDLVFLKVFNGGLYESVSLSDWLAYTPPATVSAYFNMSFQNIAKCAKGICDVVPA